MASGVCHIARDKCNFMGNLQIKSDQTNSIILIATFFHLLLAKSATLPTMDICHIGVSSDISHGRIKDAMDTNLLEVAGSSETACTLATSTPLGPPYRGF